MTEQLIEKLQHLDNVLQNTRQRYETVCNELQALKSSPSADFEELNQLKQQLEDNQHIIDKNLTEHNDLQQKYTHLDQQYQTLAEAHHELNDKYTELVAKAEALEETNHKLLEKNRLAREHTRVVYERLTKIDQA